MICIGEPRAYLPTQLYRYPLFCCFSLVVVKRIEFLGKVMMTSGNSDNSRILGIFRGRSLISVTSEISWTVDLGVLLSTQEVVGKMTENGALPPRRFGLENPDRSTF